MDSLIFQQLLSGIESNSPPDKIKYEKKTLKKSFQNKTERLEGELVKSRVENDQLVFELKVAKTRVALLEEKLAKTEIQSLNNA